MANAALEGTRDFQALMQTVAALRAHYSVIASKAEREMIRERLLGHTAAADTYKATLKVMHDRHKAALDLIAEELTTPEQLRATRTFIRKSADRANAFVKHLQQVRMTLETIAQVAGFLGEVVTGLTSILR